MQVMPLHDSDGRAEGAGRVMVFPTRPTRYLFIAGKGGVGKTSLSAAAALGLADAGKKVLLVSTDAASNLDEILDVELRNTPTPVAGAMGLSVLNIDPDRATESYRQRILAHLDAASAREDEIATMQELLSSTCAPRIASFDAFASVLCGDADDYDHVVFDTAPMEHTLSFLALPQAWSGFLKANARAASRWRAHSGSKLQAARFKGALEALSDPMRTTVFLVAQPDKASIAGAARASAQLLALGLNNQRLVINGVFRASGVRDALAGAIEAVGQAALADLPLPLRSLPQHSVPLQAFDMVGLPALRGLLNPATAPVRPDDADPVEFDADAGGLNALADKLAVAGRGLIMVMGKGGVGKTTMATALALGLVQRGKTVHLSTTDPAADLTAMPGLEVPGLRVDRIDPKLETQRHIEKIMAAKAPGLDAQEQALLLEDLRSPSTEDEAMFHAFSRLVSEGRSAYVVLDAAATGQSLGLLQAARADHRRMMKELEGHGAARVVTPLMRLQDAACTKIILVTLAEATPVSQAAALQMALRRSGIEPYAWILNRSVLAAASRDPLLAARLHGENRQRKRLSGGLAKRIYTVPERLRPPVGVVELSEVVAARPDTP